MQALTPAELVTRASDVLVPSLQTFVLAVVPAPNTNWVRYYQQRDRVDGRSFRQYSLDDPRFLLRILVTDGRKFNGQVSPLHGAFARELIHALNVAAHDRSKITPDLARRTIDTMQRLLAELAPDEAADQALQQLADSLEDGFARHHTEPDRTAKPADGIVTDASAAVSPGDTTFPEEPQTSLLEATRTEAGKPAAMTDSAWLDELTSGELPGERHVALRVGPLLVQLTHPERLSFAQTWQSIPPISELRITNASETTATLEQLRVQIDGLDDLGATLTRIVAGPEQSLDVDLDELAWKIAPERVASFAQSVQATVQLSVVVDGELRTASSPILVLARDRVSVLPRPELISTFLSSTHPAVRELTNQARELLESRTGNGAFTGYDADETRVVAVATALYDCIAERQIVFEDASTSGLDGIRIRRPYETLQDHRGTATDLCVLYASLLEAVGLDAVIVLTISGAVVGFKTQSVPLPELSVTEPEMIQNLFRSLIVQPIDPATMSAGESLAKARRATERLWDTELDSVIAVVDVASALRRMKELPVISQRGAAIVLEVAKPAPLALPQSGVHEARRALTGTTSKYPPRVERWRRSLLDLSFRNQLLKLSSRSGERLLIPELALPTFEDMLADGVQISLVAGLGLDPRQHQGSTSANQLSAAAVTDILTRERRVHVMKDAERLGSALDRLRHRAQSIVEETGNNNLFVTLGALHWRDNNGNEALAPLFLLPVKLEGRAGSKYTLRREGDDVAMYNYCLAQKLRNDYGLELAALVNPQRDEHGIDIPAVMQSIRAALVSHELPFTVGPEVHLGILQFSTLEMWRDVSDNWEILAKNPVVHHLIETPTDAFIDPVQTPHVTAENEAQEHLPVLADGSQLQAVAWARAGRTFVLEGPPGTGKSQTITNIIANALANGKSILFVAEKQAALDVVRKRLEASGLGPVTLDLHGKDLTYKAVRAQLTEAWESTTGSASVYESHRLQLRSLVTDVWGYGESLHQEGPSGSSLWQAHERVLASTGGEELQIAVPSGVVRGQTRVDNALNAIDRARRAATDLGGTLLRNPWRLIGPADAPPQEALIEDALRRLVSALPRLSEPARTLMEASHPDEWTGLSQAIAGLQASHPVIIDGSPLEVHNHAAELEGLARQLDRFAKQYAPFLAVISPAARHANVPALRQALNDAESANFFSRRKRVEVAQREIRALVREGHLHEDQLRPFLNDLEQFQIEGSALQARVVQLLPGSHADDALQTRPEQVQGLASSLAQFLETRGRLTHPGQFDVYRSQVRQGAARPTDDARAAAAVAAAWQNFTAAVHATPDTLREWTNGRPVYRALTEAIPEWQNAFESHRVGDIKRVANFRAALEELNELRFDQLARQLADGRIPTDTLVSQTRAAIDRAIENERLDATGLDRFSHVEHESRIAELSEAAAKSRDASSQALRSLIRQQHGVNTAAPCDALAALRREMQRKRGGSIRELIRDHGDSLLKLTPCLLMSPASVAKYVPAGSVTFDLVIFDEASQIRVADAVGSLGRARSAIIVGDSKQMPPTSAFAAADIMEDDTADESLAMPEDQDSILQECVDSNLDRLWLTWHYRSQDESLIAFSNRSYYRGQLASFPVPPSDDGHSAVSIRFVNGTFQRGGARTNEEEAKAIIDEIESRLRKDPRASLGVITFNTQQQDLILRKLEEKSGAVQTALTRAEDALFVKNLENVQGDERDVILFSLAFSADPATGRLPLNFGPLTREGGERRLNVAITRARQQVVLFASFQPEQIELTRTRSVGLTHLRRYMEFARGDADVHNNTAVAVTPDAHREQVADVLGSCGFEVLEGVGMSEFKVDLAVRTPESKAWVAVLLDGPSWRARTTTTDRDVLPGQLLKNRMGWSDIFRIWLPDWMRSREDVVLRLRRTAEEAARNYVPPVPDSGVEPPSELSEPVAQNELAESLPGPQVESVEPASLGNTAPKPTAITPGPAPATVQSGPRMPKPLTPKPAPTERTSRNSALSTPQPEAPVRTPAPLKAETQSPQETSPTRVEFTPAEAKNLATDVTTLDHLWDPEVRKAVRLRMEEVLDAEAPINAQRLCHIVGQSFACHRVSVKRQQHLLSLLKASQVRADVGGQKFVWSPHQNPQAYPFVRTMENDPRTIEQFPREEIRNAMWLVLKDSALPKDTLVRRTAQYLGYQRLGNRLRERLDTVLRYYSRKDVFIHEAGMYRRGDRLF